MTRTTLLWVAAAVLLAAGLAGPVLRHVNAPPDPVKEQRKRVDAEQAALRQEFARDRDRLLATMRERLQAGDAQGALSAAARFHALGDPEVNALYAEAAERESMRQRIDAVRAIVEAKCTPLAARIAATQFLRRFASLGEDANVDRLAFERLRDAEARPAVLAVIAKPRSPVAQGDDPVSLAHAAHRARLHDYDAAALQSDRWPEGIVCAWRASGPVVAGGRQRTITLDFWLAPMPVAQSLDFEALRYSAR
jgi:hypothetical protein